ncbi:glycosyltransferase [uncultured Faecalicoccus sp.]|uniref:glycosyltransferase n=1 Tax=uncultured Faecalicoccus sp. TaxID=1971760 RepID=UPI00258D4BD4|nr:glycosyltransferase [uncultured Faecalicoccus sp.]
MDDIKISIIVPVYKVEVYLERCINSLLNQTMKEIEIIMVDDGSPDNCPEMCNKYEAEYAHIHVIHKANGGLGLARNSGLEIARGKYVIFVDSDDYVTQDMCEMLYAKAEQYSADVVYANHFKDIKGKITDKVERIERDIVLESKDDIEKFNLDMIANLPESPRDTPIEVSVWAAIFNRETIENNNIRFVSERVLISEDVVFNIDFYSKANTIVICSEAVYYYCFNEESLSKSYNPNRFSKDKELWRYVLEKINGISSTAEIRCSRFLIARARCAIGMIVASNKKITRKMVKQYISEIVHDKDLIRCIANYPVHMSRGLQKIFLILMKAQSVEALFLVCKLNNWRKRN